VTAPPSPAPQNARAGGLFPAPLAGPPAAPLAVPQPGMALTDNLAPAAGLHAEPAAKAWRWRIDGTELGAASTEWLQAAKAQDTRRGQPSLLRALPQARQIELQGDRARLARLWLTPTQLLWCAAGPTPCRLSALDADVGLALLQALPPAPASSAQPPASVPAAQPPQRDSR